MLKIKNILIAIKETIFQFAALHLVILVFQAIRRGELVHLNMASVLDLRFLIPDLEYTFETGLILVIPVVLVLMVNYILINYSSHRI